ncbi:MAG: hypothetical protein A2W91_03905 [Bacteroidetes bacterium GWF2_38_335]|nr:MAG: hypothetical protein A2W91_03905 [Bacteroidetes bacterium GWF2_38_335]OFY79097.1 MAG: hypothetical protein A2281_03240 [Bacteroidetes bacterium RIFOXYA12_FULL_38_20]HBS88819.1 hypothetical protein [Bacteroidales bacterium]
MLFNNYQLFIEIIAFLAVYRTVSQFIRIAIIRNLIIFASSIIILLNFSGEHSLIVLGLLSIVVFFAGKLLQKKRYSLLLFIFLFLVIFLFLIRNYLTFRLLINNTMLEFLSAPVISVQKLGLSYIIFRYVHWLVESKKGSINRSDVLSFLNYIFFFPSYLAGPIDQYRNFHYWIRNRRNKYSWTLFFAGVSRIFIGAVKTKLIVPFVIEYALDYSVLLTDFSHSGALIISLLAYSAYIYFDFSGYSDIAIGMAYLFGIKTPENFNNPYFSTNLSDFWKRWHITFSFFLKIYVFKPVIDLINRIFKTKKRLPVSIAAYIITFVICGIWHGDTINFVYWGLWHGLGLAVNKIWLTKVKPGLKFSETRMYMVLSIIITFVFVTVGWFFFNYQHDSIVKIMTEIF